MNYFKILFCTIAALTVTSCYELSDKLVAERLNELVTIEQPRTFQLLANNKDTVSVRIRRIDASRETISLSIVAQGISFVTSTGLAQSLQLQISPGSVTDLILKSDTIPGNASFKVAPVNFDKVVGEIVSGTFTKNISLINRITLRSTTVFFDTSSASNVFNIEAVCLPALSSDGSFISTGQLVRFSARTSLSDSNSVIGRFNPASLQAPASSASIVRSGFIRRPQDKGLPSTIYLFAFTEDNRIISDPFEVYLRK